MRRATHVSSFLCTCAWRWVKLPSDDNCVCYRARGAVQAMAASAAAKFMPIAAKRYPRTTARDGAEARYWQHFDRKVVSKHMAKITRIDVCGAAPHDLAVCTSTRVRARTHTHAAAARRSGSGLAAAELIGRVSLCVALLRSVR